MFLSLTNNNGKPYPVKVQEKRTLISNGLSDSPAHRFRSGGGKSGGLVLDHPRQLLGLLHPVLNLGERGQTPHQFLFFIDLNQFVE